MLEQSVDFVNQLAWLKRLGEEEGSTFSQELHDGRVRRARDQQYSKPRIVVLKQACQFGSRKLTHDNVADEHIDGCRSSSRELEGLFRRSRFNHDVAVATKDLGHQRAQSLVVIGEQDRGRSPGSGNLIVARGHGCGVKDRGQQNVETGSSLKFARALDDAAALFDETSSGGQAHAGSVEGTLRSEQWFKAMPSRLLIHPDPRVGDRDYDVVALGEFEY